MARIPHAALEVRRNVPRVGERDATVRIELHIEPRTTTSDEAAAGMPYQGFIQGRQDHCGQIRFLIAQSALHEHFP